MQAWVTVCTWKFEFFLQISVIQLQFLLQRGVTRPSLPWTRSVLTRKMWPKGTCYAAC